MSTHIYIPRKKALRRVSSHSTVRTVILIYTQVSRELSPPVDSADLDLLHMKFLDSEAHRDEAIDARDEAIEARDKALANLARMKTEFDQAVDERDTAIRERDVALEKLMRWNEAAVSAAELARLASEQVWIARGY